VDSSANTVAPGEWVSIYGQNLAGSTLAWDGTFPTSLGGTSVTIDGKSAFLSYVSPGQINVQVPDDGKTGPVPVVVMSAAGIATSEVQLAPVSPSFPLLDSKHAAAIIIRSDGSGAYGGGTYDIVGPTGTSLGYPTFAANAGDSVELFAFGLGATSPAVPAGQPFSGAAPTVEYIPVLLNNTLVNTSFVGLSSAGLYQINFIVPSGLGTGDMPMSLTAGGIRSAPGPVISLQ
jgi:uncharacterized protein (TIGR03437 family)